MCACTFFFHLCLQDVGPGCDCPDKETKINMICWLIFRKEISSLSGLALGLEILSLGVIYDSHSK